MSLKPKYYPTVDVTTENNPYGSEFNIFSSVHFFDGTLTYIDYEIQTDSDGGRTKIPVVKNLPNLNFNAGTLLDYFANRYGDRQVAKNLVPNDSWEFDTNSWGNLYTWLYKRINFLVNANYHKYVRLVASLNFSYDPISNYDMMEIGVATGDKGESYTERTGNNSAEITSTGVIPNAALTLGGSGHPEVVSVDWSNNDDTVTTEADSTNKPTTINSVTTYDDDNPVTLSKSESIGKSTTSTHQTDKFSTTKTTGVRGWKDTTKTTTPSEDYHNLNRMGNIGVTTTQEMIQKERDIARYSVLEEFMNDVAHEILLSVWE